LRANQLAWEIETLVTAGLEPWQALAAATRNGGILLGEPEAGVIRAGGPADFVLVHGDPLSDPAAMWRVWRVSKRTPGGYILNIYAIRRGGMKTVIDLDTELVAAAAKVLGTTTKKDTIHAALRAAMDAAARRAERRQRLINSAGGPDLGDESVMAGAWS
jgi:Arc/MetJ family transcription regulator